MTEEERKAVDYYKNKEFSFICDLNTEELLKALGIETNKEDTFEEHQIRFKTLINLIQKLKEEKELNNRVIDKRNAEKLELVEMCLKKDKIIDLMADTISILDTDIPTINKQFTEEYCEFVKSDDDCCWKTGIECKQCIIEYFKRKAEEE